MYDITNKVATFVHIHNRIVFLKYNLFLSFYVDIYSKVWYIIIVPREQKKQNKRGIKKWQENRTFCMSLTLQNRD